MGNVRGARGSASALTARFVVLVRHGVIGTVLAAVGSLHCIPAMGNGLGKATGATKGATHATHATKGPSTRHTSHTCHSPRGVPLLRRQSGARTHVLHSSSGPAWLAALASAAPPRHLSGAEVGKETGATQAQHVATTPVACVLRRHSRGHTHVPLPPPQPHQETSQGPKFGRLKRPMKSGTPLGACRTAMRKGRSNLRRWNAAWEE